ncbi:hypothetical protein AB0L06_12145 [Spirillospora sp. NPDC052269]
MPRITLGRLITAVTLIYVAVLVLLFFLSFADAETERPKMLAEFVGPVSYLLSPLGLRIDEDGGSGHLLKITLLVLGLLQALAFWGLLRRRTRHWHDPIRTYVRRFAHGPAIFRVAASYGVLVSAVAVWVHITALTNSGSMAGIWLFPLLGPALIPLFAFDIELYGYLTFAGPIQAWLFWRLLRGRRIPAESE